MGTSKKINRENLSPKEALAILVDGNQRFINDVKRDQNLSLIREELKEKQEPFAAVLGCSDSRTSLELIFDQSLGDIFSVRLAGNVACKNAIGSLEYSCKYLGSKIIVVMGHSNCGAVKAACDHFKGGNIGEIIDLINPAVEAESTITNNDDRTSANDLFVEKVCFLNVQTQINRILKDSTIIQQQLEKKQVGLVGAVYNLATGHVQFNIKDALI